MTNQFANYVPVQDIAQGGDSGIIELSQNIGESVSFPQPEELVQTISETVTVNFT